MKRGEMWRVKVLAAVLAENADMALRSVKSNRLRSLLTVAIIAAGIMSLVGILTAVESMDASLKEAYGRMGAGMITVRSRHYMPQEEGRVRNPREISRSQAVRFADSYHVPSVVSVSAVLAENVKVAANGKETAPVVGIVASDEKYLSFNMLEIGLGRNMSAAEADGGRQCCLLGHNVWKSLFGTRDPSGCKVRIAGRDYAVVGVLSPVGNTAGDGADDCVIIPYAGSTDGIAGNVPDFRIGVLPDPEVDASYAVSEAERVFRAVRRLSPADITDFRITRSEAVVEELDSVIGTLTLAAVAIGLITITGAAVGLMNIMLVSVRERKREIGLRKALGASSVRIRRQFMLESVIVCEAGGLAGVLAGIAAGNAVAAVMESVFTVPWLWMSAAFALCLLVGIMSGYVPAGRAAALDPIECLRHE